MFEFEQSEVICAGGVGHECGVEDTIAIFRHVEEERVTFRILLIIICMDVLNGVNGRAIERSEYLRKIFLQERLAKDEIVPKGWRNWSGRPGVWELRDGAMVSAPDELRAEQIDERVSLKVRGVRDGMALEPAEGGLSLRIADGEVAVTRRGGHDLGRGPEAFVQGCRGRHEEGRLAAGGEQREVRVRQPEMVRDEREVALVARQHERHVQMADAPRRELGHVEFVRVEASRERRRYGGRPRARRAIVDDAAWFFCNRQIGRGLMGRARVARSVRR